MVTVLIQYSDGTFKEVQMLRQDAMQLVDRKNNGELSNIIKIEVKLGGEGR